MFRFLRRGLNAGWAIAAVAAKRNLTYVGAAWLEVFLPIISMLVFIYFWRAVYAGHATVRGGLSLQQTLNYILLAQLLLPFLGQHLIQEFGWLLQDGEIAVELMRPVDLQLRFYAEQSTWMLLALIFKLPLILIAWIFLGLQLPADLGVWVAFLISLLLGYTILFFFDWTFACLAFYTTETWGLQAMRVGVATFFSGALIPLAIMPEWLQAIAQALPFAQAIAVPISLLSQVTPVTEAFRVWLTQIAWIIGLGVLSRVVFRLTVRKVTIQGG